MNKEILWITDLGHDCLWCNHADRRILTIHSTAEKALTAAKSMLGQGFDREGGIALRLLAVFTAAERPSVVEGRHGRSGGG